MEATRGGAIEGQELANSERACPVLRSGEGPRRSLDSPRLGFESGAPIGKSIRETVEDRLSVEVEAGNSLRSLASRPRVQQPNCRSL